MPAYMAVSNLRSMISMGPTRPAMWALLLISLLKEQRQDFYSCLNNSSEFYLTRVNQNELKGSVLAH
jgi:hypothetical protein